LPVQKGPIAQPADPRSGVQRRIESARRADGQWVLEAASEPCRAKYP